MASYCNQLGCDKPVKSRGLCGMHYMRLLRTGDPSKVRRVVRTGLSEAERFWAFVDKTEACWLWMGAVDTKGYGVFTVTDRKKHRAHRYSYQLVVGAIPDGMDLDHLCRARACCNPAHLEPVTRQVNIQRGANRNREKTHCKRGHEFTEANIYPTKNGRGCRACRAAYFKERDKNRARKRQKESR